MIKTDDFESLKMIKHRNFFKESLKFNNLLNLDDETLLTRIHMNYRLAYLRDTAIGRFIEEMTIKHINIMIHFNNSEIVQYFLNQKFLLKKVVDNMLSEKLNEKYDAVLFLVELIQCCKDLIQTRFYFYECLCDLNIIEAIEQILVDITNYTEYNKYFENLKEDKLSPKDLSQEVDPLPDKIKINSIEILINIISVVPSKLLF
jgi:hypothetical protein